MLAEGHHELDRLTTAGAATSGSVAMDPTYDGLKVSPVESVTLSDGEVQENAYSPAYGRQRSYCGGRRIARAEPG